jgi:hypothetical protein
MSMASTNSLPPATLVIRWMAGREDNLQLYRQRGIFAGRPEGL